MESSGGQVQQTPWRHSGGRDRRRLNDEMATAQCTRSSLSATGRQVGSSSANLVATDSVRSRQRPTFTSQHHTSDCWWRSLVRICATCLHHSWQHNSWHSVTGSLPRQHGKTSSSVQYDYNSKTTAVRLILTILKRKVCSVHCPLTRVLIKASAGQVITQFRQTLGAET